MLAHLSALSGFLIPLGTIIGPLLIWQIKKNEIPTVEAHGKDALNFQITVLIAFFVCFLLMFVGIGILLMPIVGIGALVCTIIAGIKANNGERWKYPASFTFLK